MRAVPPAFAVALLLAAPLAGQERTLDDFEDVSDWTAAPSEGVRLEISHGEGRRGHALRLDFDFRGGAGYAIARRRIDLDLPANYRFTYWLRADAPINNLEFKLVDPSGENVWWANRRAFRFPEEWRRMRVKKRHLEFAWGPAGGGEMGRAAALEVVVTAGTGGKGTVWIDELTFESLPPERPYDRTPELTASASAAGQPPRLALDGDPATAWRSGRSPSNAWLSIDFLEPREYGGLTIDWEPGQHALDYRIEISDDGEAWEPARSVQGSNGGRDWLPLPESESRHLRIVMEAAPGTDGYGIRQIEVQPLEFADSPNGFFEIVARAAPRGSFPRYFEGVQAYWTVVGVDGDEKEALIDTDGRLEVDQAAFSLEPFLLVDGRLLSWADAESEPTLMDGDLPIPSVTRTHDDLELEVTAFATGEPGASTLYARYQVTNRGADRAEGRFFLALRPFQVNPPWQFLGVPGGAAEIRAIAWDGSQATVETGAGPPKTVVPLQPPEGFGAAAFDAGEIVEHLREGALPTGVRADDPTGSASAALAWDFALGPGETREVDVAVPFHPGTPLPPDDLSGEGRVAALQQETAEAWRRSLNRVRLDLPPDAVRLAQTMVSTLAYILINRDGPAIQPGSRSYDRSWIRDGALTSTALLRLGHFDEVRTFIEWFAGYQFPSGKIPCCVDDRGADPVPENDSNGQFLFLVTEYHRYTGDTTLLRAMWPHMERAVAYLDSLRQSRRTAEYRTEEKRVFFGLLPESISHEGYSSKPMHSYWDDFFALKGLADAVESARVLGEGAAAERFAAIHDQFRADLFASLERAIARHGIDYIPGAAELGDLDPTSTTIALDPVGIRDQLPQRALERTFDRHWEQHQARRAGTDSGEAYTPYELRTVGSFVRLGREEQAWDLLDFYLADRRPPAWNQWAEVVWRDPATPSFIGDMPHTWVGSDFIRSFLDLLAYVHDADQALVLGAGIPAAWLEGPPIGALGLPTYWGTLDYRLVPVAGGVRIELGGEMRVPPGGFVLRAPIGRRITGATVNGRTVPVGVGGTFVVAARFPVIAELQLGAATAGSAERGSAAADR